MLYALCVHWGAVLQRTVLQFMVFVLLVVFLCSVGRDVRPHVS